ncbi:MAG: PAS domain S-box protein [Pseudomonadota bacterium]
MKRGSPTDIAADADSSKNSLRAAAKATRKDNLLKTGALQNAILNSTDFSSIATDASGVIQIFNGGAEHMLGYTAAEVLNLVTPADISDPQELIARAKALSLEFGMPITPGFAALVFKASRGIEDIYELTYIRKDGSRFPAVVSVTALRNEQDHIIGYLLIGTDNTARQQVDAARQTSEARADGIIASALDAIVAIDSNKRITLFNLAAENMFGLTSAEVLGSNLDRLIPLRFRATHNGKINAFGETNSGKHIMGKPGTIFALHADGREFPVDASISQNQLNGEKMFTVMLRDITERRKSEESVLKAGALQNAIFNSANFSSIATDARGVIQIFNVGAERMLGYTAAEVMNLITPADISDPQEVIARATALSLELGTPITPGFEALVFKASRGIEDIYELTYIRKDGSRFPAVVSVTALRDAQENIIGYLLIGTDNTARKLVEAEQRKLDQRLRDQQFYTRSLIESNIDALMTTDPSGIITDVNKQMEALTDCTRDELIGAPFKNYFTDPERAEAGINRVLREKKVSNYELTARARDGKETVVSYNASTFYDRDRTLQGVFAAARDITERKVLDQALQETNVELQSAKVLAEKANLAKSDFLSSMSHELRSPLNAILGFAQLIESDPVPPTASQKRGIDQILHAGWYLLDLINEILDLAQIESGKLSLSLESISLTSILQECEAMIKPQAQKRGISVTFPPLHAQYCVRGDRTRVKQVLINLLSNAIKYNRLDGTVVVSCITDSPARVRICVEDSGEGLTPDKIAQLFQPFNRLGQELNVGEGTGIGLVVSKQLTELMGGVIGVESTVGKGSVFWIEMNRVTELQLAVETAAPITIAPAAVAVAGEMRTVLYVEDNPANLMLVEDLITRRPDIRLLSARDGNEGVKIARASRPDVILMDINLPGISGVKAMKILAEDPTTADIPIIALSANAMPSDIEKGLAAGFFRYLTKPIVVTEFFTTLEMALQFSNARLLRSQKVEKP